MTVHCHEMIKTLRNIDLGKAINKEVFSRTILKFEQAPDRIERIEQESLPYNPELHLMAPSMCIQNRIEFERGHARVLRCATGVPIGTDFQNFLQLPHARLLYVVCYIEQHRSIISSNIESRPLLPLQT